MLASISKICISINIKVLLTLKRYQEGLDAANAGLEVAPNNTEIASIRNKVSLLIVDGHISTQLLY